MVVLCYTTYSFKNYIEIIGIPLHRMGRRTGIGGSIL